MGELEWLFCYSSPIWTYPAFRKQKGSRTDLQVVQIALANMNALLLS